MMTRRMLSRPGARLCFSFAAVVLIALGLAACEPPPSGGSFTDTIVFRGLTAPTTFRFASDGRVFVAEKSGLIKVFDSLRDTTPTIFADLRTEVDNYWDRGLLGLALHPDFPQKPWVYVLYSRDAPVGGTAPVWHDACPTPPGAVDDGCVISGRLARLKASGDHMTEPMQVLIDGWCQQYPSHSIGDLQFGSDGALYVSGGDGAGFSTWLDYGQRGSPRTNPCGDPPGGVGGAMRSPSAEGGALRAQDLRTATDPAGLNGALLRVNPDTGAGLPDNPLASSSDPNARRIVAYGFRNPFRFVMRPPSSEVWVGDVGWQTYEEINRVNNPKSPKVANFGWPCYESASRQPAWDSANFSICENLYAAGSSAVTAPVFRYDHGAAVVAGDKCGGGGSITGLAFMPADAIAYPAEYQGAMFFADYSRECIWVAPRQGPNAPYPDMSKRQLFMAASEPVDLQIGPNGDLFYADLTGSIHEIRYNSPPIAVINADTKFGPRPLTVHFDGTASYATYASPLTYAWDLDGDGAFDDSTSPEPTFTYTGSQNVTVRLKVTDNGGGVGTATTVVRPGDTPPQPVIDTPPTGTTWHVGQNIDFSGHATDAEQGSLPSSALQWTLLLHHCPSSCHLHTIQTFDQTDHGSFVAPEHDYPSYLELKLKATDARGLVFTSSVRLDPQTATLTLQSDPSGLNAAAGFTTGTTPFTITAISGSSVTVSAPSPQTMGGTNYQFDSWSDGGAQTHDIVVSTARTFRARYTASP